MKMGIRKPSIKKSFSARTTGKAKRKLKRLTNPFYGKKGMGFIKNPIKSIKGKIYRKTTISAKDAVKKSGGCLGILIIWPLYLMWYMLVLMWYMIKYTVMGFVWLFVFLLNACISLFEWIINIMDKNRINNSNTNIEGDEAEKVFEGNEEGNVQ